MKKVPLLMFFIFPLILNAQSYFHSTMENTGRWNDYNEEWDYDGWKSLRLTFTIFEDYISVTDNADSHYSLTSKMSVARSYDPKIMTWDAVDERGRNCSFQIEQDTDKNWYIRVVYSDVCYKYLMSGSYSN